MEREKQSEKRHLPLTIGSKKGQNPTVQIVVVSSLWRQKWDQKSRNSYLQLGKDQRREGSSVPPLKREGFVHCRPTYPIAVDGETKPRLFAFIQWLFQQQWSLTSYVANNYTGSRWQAGLARPEAKMNLCAQVSCSIQVPEHLAKCTSCSQKTPRANARVGADPVVHLSSQMLHLGHKAPSSAAGVWEFI